MRGRNYLIPVDADIQSESSARFAAVDVSDVTEAMEFSKSRVNFVILDACRNNPFERSFRGSGRGLAAVDAAKGTLIAYATAPGSVAADGEGSNGLYTESLLAVLDTPGLSAEEIFKRVRARVDTKSGGRQTPWESSSLTGNFVFNAPGTVTVQPSAPATSRPSSDREVVFWDSVKDSANPAMFQEYLRKYPDGEFAGLARIQMESLNAAKESHLTPAIAAIQPPPSATKPSPDAEKRQRIESLLAAAAKDVSALRLTSPKGNNAVDKYNTVLGLEAENARAVAGLGDVVGKYIALAEKYSTRGNRAAVKRYLDRADEVQEDSEAAEEARERLLARTPAVTTSTPASTAPTQSNELTVQPSAPATPRPSSDRDALSWESVKDSDDPAMFHAYLQKYPDGEFVELARIQMGSLNAAQSVATRGGTASKSTGPPPSRKEPRRFALLNPRLTYNADTDCIDASGVFSKKFGVERVIVTAFRAAGWQRASGLIGDQVWTTDSSGPAPDSDRVASMARKANFDGVVMMHFDASTCVYTDAWTRVEVFFVNSEDGQIVSASGDSASIRSLVSKLQSQLPQ
ncbi:MAG: hypothetical protein HOI95_00975 [Chromatiales bacterium]|nr:hypothetical protein [Chromatiales bacterium]